MMGGGLRWFIRVFDSLSFNRVLLIAICLWRGRLTGMAQSTWPTVVVISYNETWGPISIVIPDGMGVTMLAAVTLEAK